MPPMVRPGSEGAVKPPVFLTSTFVFRTAEDGQDFFDFVSGRRELPKGMGAAPQGRNCGILRQTRWDGSMKRRTLKWHLLLVLSVLVSCDCTRI
jgi:cystathionine beta-lyase/cystathionine gamma-synthase